jgi:hypothetical protein
LDDGQKLRDSLEHVGTVRFTTPAIHTACSVGLALYSTPGVIVFSHAHAATLVMSHKFADRIRKGHLVR